MAKRRSQVELAAEAKARVEKERAKLELAQLKVKRQTVNARAKMLAVHRAAQQNRFNKDWTAIATSGDSATVPDLPRLNARARQMVRDEPWAKSIVRAYRRNVIGTGITPSIDGLPFKKSWERWSRRPELMEMERRRNFRMVQQWACDEMVTVGEAFVVRWIIGGRLVLQCFEFEQLDQYKIGERATGNEVRHGIEVDENGAAVAYHFYRHHPNDIRGLARPAPLSLDSMRVPASMVSHIYDPERVRQTHGVTRFAPVLQNIRDASEYDNSELRAARAQASIGLLIRGGDDGDDPLELDGLNVAYLGDSEEVTAFTPNRPSGQYAPFMQTQLRRLAAGAGLSYEQVGRDYSSVNFSSGRLSGIDDRREILPIQEQIITQLCEPVMRDFRFVWSCQNPELSGSYFLQDEDDDGAVDWKGQGFEWTDQEQQGKGVERMMRLGLSTRTIEAAKLGLSVEKLDEQRKADGTLEVLKAMQPDKREVPGIDEVQPTNAEVTNAA